MVAACLFFCGKIWSVEGIKHLFSNEIVREEKSMIVLVKETRNALKDLESG